MGQGAGAGAQTDTGGGGARAQARVGHRRRVTVAWQHVLLHSCGTRRDAMRGIVLQVVDIVVVVVVVVNGKKIPKVKMCH